MQSQWLWIIVLCWSGCVGIVVCYSEAVDGFQGVDTVSVNVNHGESYALPVVVNHYVLFCASRCEPWRVMLWQWLWITFCYSVPVGVNHGELCWAQCVGVILCHAKPVVVNHCAMLNRVCGNHGVLFWASGFWIVVRYAEPVVCESWCAMLYQWWWIMESHAQPVVVNHGVLLCANKFEPWWGMLRQRLTIIVYYTESLVVHHCEICWYSGCELWWGVLSQWFVNHGVQCCTSGGESWRVMLRQWLWNIVSDAKTSGRNHDVLCWASGCESRGVILCK